ncbi:MAG TPA: hypothetical protein VKA92_11420 [Segetibacter sp.]|nr:hypothetical protein [Segetibacter sp.]
MRSKQANKSKTRYFPCFETSHVALPPWARSTLSTTDCPTPQLPAYIFVSPVAQSPKVTSAERPFKLNSEMNVKAPDVIQVIFALLSLDNLR